MKIHISILRAEFDFDNIFAQLGVKMDHLENRFFDEVNLKVVFGEAVASPSLLVRIIRLD